MVDFLTIDVEATRLPDEEAVLRTIRERICSIAAALVAIGLVLVYSASMVKARDIGWEAHFLVHQCKWLALALAGFGVTCWLDYRWLRRLAIPIGLVTVALLVAVRVPGIGTKVRGAYRWLRFGGLNMQPSELAKLAMVIVLAALLSRTKGHLRFVRDIIPAVGLILLTVGLVMIEPDLGTAALLGVVLSAMLLVGGARFWHVLLLAMFAVPPAAVVGWTKFDHVQMRVQAWLAGETTGAGYQTWMSQIALGTGGLTGVGLGRGSAKLHYLPDAHTDFILAVGGEELGLLGTGAIVFLFGWLLWEGLRLVEHAPDRFGSLVAFGITFWIGLQAIFNIAVVTASIPPKGISLPFVSFGGSGLCVALAAVGVLVSITRCRSESMAVETEPLVAASTSLQEAA